MAHESCKSQIAVLEMNGQSVPQRWTSMREGSNTARRYGAFTVLKLTRFSESSIFANGSIEAFGEAVSDRHYGLQWVIHCHVFFSCRRILQPQHCLRDDEANVAKIVLNAKDIVSVVFV